MALKRLVAVWDWLTFAGLALSFFCLMALWYRWLRPDPEFLDFSTKVIGLFAVGSFLGLQTAGGKNLVLRLDNFLGLGRWLKSPPRACALAWSLLAVLAALLYIATPLAARSYRQGGVTAFEEGAYSQAVARFRQALSLAPDDPRTHYNLATSYEQLYDYEKAIAEYQLALEQDDTFWPAYNNLGRLYLVARQDPNAALSTLLNGEQRAGDALSRAVLSKNVAWAFLEKGLPLAALQRLQAAIAQFEAGQETDGGAEGYLAEGYQLLARIYQAQDDAGAAHNAWQNSLGYALAVRESSACTAGQRLPPDCLAAARWAAEAQEMLVHEP